MISAASSSTRRWFRLGQLAGGLLLVLAAWIWFGNDIARRFESDAPSRSFGTPADGRLENGKRLPNAGENFVAYSRLGTALGRNAVHERVRATVLDAYAAMARSHPETRFVYGETGWPSGGRFRPHRTHRNGMSVDFMVPIVDAAGVSQRLPTSIFDKFGYAHEFSDEGTLGAWHIDNAALAAHLLALEAAAARHGLRIRMVIYDPPLQPALFAAPGGAELAARLRFSPKREWVRHDEHYHVNFEPAAP